MSPFKFRAIFFCIFQLFVKYFSNIIKLDPDPHWEEQLDPDPQKMNADPQPCRIDTVMYSEVWYWYGYGYGYGITKQKNIVWIRKVLHTRRYNHYFIYTRQSEFSQEFSFLSEFDTPISGKWPQLNTEMSSTTISAEWRNDIHWPSSTKVIRYAQSRFH